MVITKILLAVFPAAFAVSAGFILAIAASTFIAHIIDQRFDPSSYSPEKYYETYRERLEKEYELACTKIGVVFDETAVFIKEHVARRYKSYCPEAHYGKS